MTPVAVKSTAINILLLAFMWAQANICQNSDMTHMRLNMIDRHHVDSLLFNKVVKKKKCLPVQLYQSLFF